MKALPLYAMALLKHPALRPGTNPDTRAAVISNIEIMGVEDLVLYLYPRMMLVRHASLFFPYSALLLDQNSSSFSVCLRSLFYSSVLPFHSSHV